MPQGMHSGSISPDPGIPTFILLSARMIRSMPDQLRRRPACRKPRNPSPAFLFPASPACRKTCAPASSTCRRRRASSPTSSSRSRTGPSEFRAFFAYHDALMLKEAGLSKGEREMIIVATSGANRCLYCVVAHGAILRIYEKNPLLADQVAINYRKADITPRQRAMLDFAIKVCAALRRARRSRLRRAARARLLRRGRLGHRRDHRVLRHVEPHRQHRSACGPTTSST